MAVIQLKGTKRAEIGKGGARKARAAGKIPGVLYGHGEAPVAVAVESKDFEIALRGHKGGNAIVNLNVGHGDVTALVRDVQLDPLTRRIIHLDFHHISLTEQIVVEVALHFVGTPIGVKDGGGILEHIVRTLEVRCLPTAIPPSIDVDVTGLNIGQNLHVRDITVSGFEIVTDPEVTIAAVVAPAAEEVVAAKGKKEAEPAAEGGKEAKKEKK